MKKQEIFDAFNERISKTAIVRRDGEYVIQGNYCLITPSGNGWDVWICNPKDIAAGLGQRAVLNRVRALENVPLIRPWAILDGEAHAILESVDSILSNLKLLGIRRKRSANPVLSGAVA